MKKTTTKPRAQLFRASLVAKRIKAEGLERKVNRGRPSRGRDVGTRGTTFVRLLPSVWARLEREARAEGVAVPALVRTAIVAWLNRTEEPMRVNRGYKLEEDLITACKHLALDQGRTLYELMEDALRQYLTSQGALVRSRGSVARRRRPRRAPPSSTRQNACGRRGGA